MGFLGFSLIPREPKFFDMFEEAAATLAAAAGKFVDLLVIYDNLPERCQELKREESRLDDMVGGIITVLDQTFITPIDREDIHALAIALDDVMDDMEETAHRFGAFRIDRPTEEAIRLGRIIQECCTHLEHAIRLCRNLRRSEEIQQCLREISLLENEADRIYRDSDSALFANGNIDVLTLIKLRELYGWLEDTVDACREASQVIAEIVVKGS